jgi:23S rRNA-/tRNA-specific pseudouridylate synthase
VLQKPAGCCLDAHPLFEATPSLVAAINRQARAGKPELARLNLTQVFEVYAMEPEVEGLALLANGAPARESLRNAFGSEQVLLQFHFVARDMSAKGERVRACTLPLARHSKEARMLVSHKTGKKSCTVFEQVRLLDGGYALWSATTQYLRVHQIRLHAFEVGLRLPGESLYLAQDCREPAGSEPLRLWLTRVEIPGVLQLQRRLPSAHELRRLVASCTRQTR